MTDQHAELDALILCPNCRHILCEKSHRPVLFGRCEQCDALLEDDNNDGYRVWNRGQP